MLLPENKIRYHSAEHGDPNDTTNTKDNDRPLPFELKDRVNTHTQKRINTDFDKYNKEIEQSSTYNALVRKEIKAGNL